MIEKPYSVETRPRWLIAGFAEPWNIVSWAVANGGWQRVQQVAWLYLRLHEIAEVQDIEGWMRGEMHREELAGAVGFMTSRRALEWVETEAVEADARAWAVGTVGLSNRLRAGDGVSVRECGTINLLVCCSQALTVEAALEASCLVSEAKALAMVESGERSVQSGLAASGTGTDCIAVAWPVHGERLRYAGKHTAVGSAMGRAAFDLVAEGIRVWRAEQV